MGIVSHYQRAALLYFADEMSTAAKMLARLNPKSEATNETYRERMNLVQMQFLKFRSRSYFPEITNQLQGEEMNRMWHTHLRIRELFEAVDRTCDQINEVFTQRASERLARIATKLLPLSVAFSLLSVLFASDFLPKYLGLWDETDWNWGWSYLLRAPHCLAFTSLAATGLAWLYGRKLARDPRR